MLSIGVLGAGGEEYFISLTAEGNGPSRADEYYTARGEAPGVWVGSGCESLGLSGRVDPADLRVVLEGRHPRSGQPLVSRLSAARRSRPGLYLTFSAPKGASLIGLLGDPATSAAVRRAHHEALEDALGFLERNFLFARRGKDGARRVATGGFVAAGFEHTTSRAGDPQLHTHVLAANLVEATDGGWSAPDSRSLFRAARTAGFVYQASLRWRLTRDLGVGWGAVRKGMAEPAGLPTGVLRAFSNRRRDIEAHLALHGQAGAASAQVAAFATRAAKDHSVSAEVLAESWRVRAHAAGLSLGDLRELTAGGGRAPRSLSDRFERLADHLAGPDGLTKQSSSFDRRDLIRALAEAADQGATAAELEGLADLFLSDPRVIAVASRHQVEVSKASGRVELRWTTQDLLDVEQAVLDRAGRLRDAQRGVVDDACLQAALARRPTLTVEQRLAVMRMTTGGEGVFVLVGRAGTGKTFALDAAREAWQAAGHPVLGAAPSARAAVELQDGSGIASTTLARLLIDATGTAAGGFAPGSVIVVDEAAMAGTRDLARLVEVADVHGAKVVLVGDPDQLPEIDAGGMVRALAGRVGAPELADNRRQVNAWEREALADLRAGRTGEAVSVYRDHGRVVVCPTAPEVLAAMVADWWAARQAGSVCAMFALRRSEVAELNRLARAVMADAGQLTGAGVRVAGREFTPGDEVVALRNNRSVGLLNGTKAMVTHVDASTGRLTVETSDGRTVVVPSGYLQAGHLDHGYALTLHKAQGATVDCAFLLGSAGLYREAGYVGLSRGRQVNNLYVIANPDDPDIGEHPVVEVRQTEGVDLLVDSLGISRSQTLATDTGRLLGARLTLAELEARRVALADRPGELDVEGYQSLTAAMAERARVLAAAAVAAPAPYLLDRLGPPPLMGVDRARWAQAASAIEAYRERFAVTDNDSALGPVPDDPWQRAARDHAAERVRRAAVQLGVDEPDRQLEVTR